ncbi:hypothetical protein, partial [Salmonella enterica]|uniref:hypothetical protein n=1 Tax=Salmonella enterica TaxID=28901 RepID=UPI001F1989A1
KGAAVRSVRSVREYMRAVSPAIHFRAFFPPLFVSCLHKTTTVVAEGAFLSEIFDFRKARLVVSPLR